jgi:hypothetical protein
MRVCMAWWWPSKCRNNQATNKTLHVVYTQWLCIAEYYLLLKNKMTKYNILKDMEYNIFVGYLTTLSIAKLYIYIYIYIYEWWFGKTRSWPNRCTIPAYEWRDWGKPRWASARMAYVPAQIRTEHLPNTSQKLCRDTITLSSIKYRQAHIIGNGNFYFTYCTVIKWQ